MDYKRDWTCFLRDGMDLIDFNGLKARKMRNDLTLTLLMGRNSMML